MKKTHITLMALAGAVSMSYAAETTITINGNSSGNIRFSGSSNYDTYTYDTVADATVAVIEPNSGGANMKTVKLNVAKDVTLTVSNYVKLNNKAITNLTGSITLADGATLSVTNYIQFNSNNTSNGITLNANNTTTGVITLGKGATITASSIDFVNGQSNQSLTLNALFTDEIMLNLVDEAVAGTIYTQNLITLTNGIRNMGAITSTNLKLNNISQLDALGYTNVGYITSADKLEKGQYGLVYTNSGMKLAAAAIPEPTTATLSLLALAGLAARRRRR